MAKPKVVFLMADYGNDPTEVATPFTVFQDAGYDITFATENGTQPKCDARMLEGLTQKLLGAKRGAIEQHNAMLKSPAIQNPVSWTADSFSLESYDLIFLPGGHDKGMRQVITSKPLHSQLAKYMPLTQRDGPGKKSAAAICHGVQVLAAADVDDGSGKSVIHDFETTSLIGLMEKSVFWGTRLFLGDYYKTFGYGTDDVETIVRNRLDNPEKQYKSSMSSSPFVHADPKYNYLSARFPPDADLLARKTVELVNGLTKSNL